MRFFDFEYDGYSLNDMGYILCHFGSNELKTVTNGSQITFDTIPIFNGKKYTLSNSSYKDCLKATFQICKNECNNFGTSIISVNELRKLSRWLNRSEFHKFRFLKDEYYNIWFESSFNINKIELNGEIVGLELEMFTNKPFATGTPIVVKSTLTKDKSLILYDSSDEEGYIYPNKMKIILKESGDIMLTNLIENRVTYIKNCISGEILDFNYPLIKSSISNHKIQDDFNWTFFRIANNFMNNKNEILTNINCDIELEYEPIIKVGL